MSAYPSSGVPPYPAGHVPPVGWGLARQAAALWWDGIGAADEAASLDLDALVASIARRIGAAGAALALERVEGAMSDLLHQRARGRLEARAALGG